MKKRMNRMNLHAQQLLSLFAILLILALPAFAVNISVGEVTAQPGGSVTVPVTITDNTGICGATIKLTYAEGLTLTAIEKGTALSSLSLTPPGSMSVNPVVLVWDGLTADNSNGATVNLVFTAPQAVGRYPITLEFDPDDIVDGDLLPVDITGTSGAVIVQGTQPDPDNPTPGDPVQGEAVISAAKVIASPGETVSMPINLTNNPGICGATIKLAYSEGLTLTAIEKGTALSSLNMTPPGSMSVNPIVLVWDSMYEDDSNGTIAVLTFTAPQKAGTYAVSISFDPDDIVNEALDLVPMTSVDGSVTVKAGDETTKLTINDECDIPSRGDSGIIFRAFIDTASKTAADEFGFIAARTASLSENPDALCFPDGFVSLAGEGETKEGTTAEGVTFVCGTSYDKAGAVNKYESTVKDGDEGFRFSVVLIGYNGSKAQYTEKISVRPYTRIGGTYFYGAVKSQDVYSAAKLIADAGGDVNDYVKYIIKICERD